MNVVQGLQGVRGESPTASPRAARSGVFCATGDDGNTKEERARGRAHMRVHSIVKGENAPRGRCTPSEMIVHDTRPSRPLSLHGTRPGEGPQTPVVCQWALWAAARQYRCCRLLRQTALIGAGVYVGHDFGAAHTTPLGGESLWCGRRFESAAVPRVDFISKRRRSLVPQEEY